MHFRMPVIETADDRDLAGVGSPHAEAGTDLSAGVEDMRPHFLVSSVIAPFVEQIQVLFREQLDVVTDGAGSGFGGLHHRFSERWPTQRICPSVSTCRNLRFGRKPVRDLPAVPRR